MVQPQPPEANVSSEFPFTLNRVKVFESEMAYVDTGKPLNSEHATEGTVVFLHGNPTSSYLYRNIIPHVSPKFRCVAPDLIGMGASDKPRIEYRFVDHARYLSKFFDAVIPSGKIILVIQDWGSALGFDWAYQHQNRVAGLAFMEFIRPFPTWDSMIMGKMQETFRSFRDEVQGRRMIIEENLFIEAMMPRGLVRQLTPAEHDYYRKPYLDPASREPIFSWPNEIPIEGNPPDVNERVERYHDWLIKNELPKIFFWATPGRIVSEEKAKWYLENLKNTTGVYVGQGMHFLQEDHPNLIGTEIAKWLVSLEL